MQIYTRQNCETIVGNVEEYTNLTLIRLKPNGKEHDMK